MERQFTFTRTVPVIGPVNRQRLAQPAGPTRNEQPPSILRGVLVLVLLGVASLAHAAPMTVSGASFTLVATGPGTTELAELTSDTQGRVYVGNNTNDTTGIPVQLFDPASFVGSPVVLQDFGPSVGDADGIAFHGGFIYVPDRDEGIRQIAVPSGTSSLYIAGVAINPTGSPLVIRQSDGHLFVGLGGGGSDRIDEYDDVGTFVSSHPTGSNVETMTYDPAAGLIYYAPFGSDVRALNPVTDADIYVGSSSGTIDGGLAFDPRSGFLFVGTANGVNAGLVETIDPSTGITQPFASGFDGSLGILREPVSGDLYFLETNQLYRLPSAQVSLPLCGNGMIDAGEECDDGNILDGDCCTSACQMPSGCLSPGKSVLVLNDKAPDTKDKIAWKWLKGTATASQFGAPPTTTNQHLCIWDDGSLVLDAKIDAGGNCGTADCWKALGQPPKAYLYKNKSSNDAGIFLLKEKGGSGNATITLKGKGTNLPLPGPVSASQYFHQTSTVTVQLIGDNAPACWEAAFAGSKKNTATTFKAVTP